MSFLALVLALLLLQFWGSDVPLHRDQWFHRLRETLGRHLSSPLWSGLAAIALPALALWWILDMVRPLLFGLVWIAASAAVLLYSVGRTDFRGLVTRYRNYCLQGDFQAAYLFLCQQPGADTGGSPPESPSALRWQAREMLLYEGFQRWFPVLLYFLLLGPVGALVYRLVQLGAPGSAGESDASASVALIHWLDWLPARLLALTFALTGDFVRSGRVLREGLAPDIPARELLHRVACAAALGPVDRGGESSAGDRMEDSVGGPVEGSVEGRAAADEAGELADLLSRSGVLWVALAAVATLLLQ